MINDSLVKEVLTQAKLWGNENLYFLGVCKIGYVIINMTDLGVGVLPTKLVPGDLVLTPQAAWFLSNEEIKSVEIKKSFMAKKVIISTSASKPFVFTVQHTDLRLREHEQNFNKFMAMYS